VGHHLDNTQEKIITPKDLEDLKFGLEQKVEYIALSYVGKAEDVSELKKNIENLGGSAKVIAKIERDEALANLDEILAVSDAIMIARGDLGNEVSLEEIPWYEKEIIKKCKLAGKPVIVATQMMISMMRNDEPTRAEVTDVFFAIENGADAVMLSDETAVGQYPVEAVGEMEKVIRETETHYENKLNPLGSSASKSLFSLIFSSSSTISSLLFKVIATESSANFLYFSIDLNCSRIISFEHMPGEFFSYSLQLE